MEVTSKDWVGQVSPPSRLTLLRDRAGPAFDLSGIPRWVNVPEPAFEVAVWDADTGTPATSGLDPLSIRFRTVDERGNISDWLEPSKVSEVPDMPGRYSAIIEPTLSRDWRGEVQLTASDVEHNENMSPLIEVGVDLKPPEITIMKPASGETIEGSRVDLVIRGTDFKGSGFDAVTLEYKVNHEEEWSNWTRIPFDVRGEEVTLNLSLDLPFGLVEMVFRGSDVMGNRCQSPSFYLTVKMPVVNRKPIPIIKTPLNNSVFGYGVPVYLSSEGTSDDGIGEYSPVRLTWISSIDGLLGTSRVLDVMLKPGKHRISLYADDGAPGHNVSVFVNITVLEPEDPNGTGPIDPIDEEETPWVAFIVTLVVMVLIVIAVIAVMVFISRRRESEETQLWVIDETQDDREYRARKREEDRDRGFDIEEGEEPV
ncbi:MAG: hypothetical protein ACMUHY_05650 [Thermoplasmatota archaeon]